MIKVWIQSESNSALQPLLLVSWPVPEADFQWFNNEVQLMFSAAWSQCRTYLVFCFLLFSSVWRRQALLAGPCGGRSTKTCFTFHWRVGFFSSIVLIVFLCLISCLYTWRLSDPFPTFLSFNTYANPFFFFFFF